MNWIRTIINLGLTVILSWNCSTTHFQVDIEPSGTRIMNGIFHRSDLEHDSTFTWFKTNYESYAVDPTAIQEIKNRSGDIHFVLVLGTWCGDSKREVPQIFKIMDAAAFNDHEIVLIGVDRSKKSRDGLDEKYTIQRVPTLIVLRDDQELGRIVEYPKETIERDIVRILQKQ